MARYVPQHSAGHAEEPKATPLWMLLGPVAAAVVVIGLLLVPWIIDSVQGGDGDDAALVAPDDATPTAEASPTPPPSPTPTSVPTPTATPRPTPTPTPTPYEGLVDPASVGTQYSETVPGLLTFRGNPTRTFYGTGPVPTAPEVQWVYPESTTMCGLTTIGGEASTWCGTGWTGQPAVFERDDTTWVVFGALDHDVHFVDADSGAPLLDPFPTGDIIKGSVTVDPDGFPLVFSGSRDGALHLIATDREQPTELWQLPATGVPGTRWNDDWDGSPLVLDDYLFVGGENSIFYIVKLNRDYGEDGLVTVDPEVVFNTPGYDDELIAAVGPNVSIENSVAVSGETVYFANSGGLVQGWDVSGLLDADESGEFVEPERVFRYWVGDDVDATLLVDEEGFLYVSAEHERSNARSAEVGQLVKLDPSADDPLVWSVFANERTPDGFWATPAIYRDLIIAASDPGTLFGIDRATGEIRWEIPMPPLTWSSPVVVDDVLLQADCDGHIHAFDLTDTTIEPPELWTVDLGACVESTPAVWDGRIIVGTRGGQVFMLSD